MTRLSTSTLNFYPTGSKNQPEKTLTLILPENPKIAPAAIAISGAVPDVRAEEEGAPVADARPAAGPAVAIRAADGLAVAGRTPAATVALNEEEAALPGPADRDPAQPKAPRAEKRLRKSKSRTVLRGNPAGGTSNLADATVGSAPIIGAHVLAVRNHGGTYVTSLRTATGGISLSAAATMAELRSGLQFRCPWTLCRNRPASSRSQSR